MKKFLLALPLIMATTVSAFADEHEGHEWVNLLKNGDAAEDFDPTISCSDETMNYAVCAWSKVNCGAAVPAPVEEVDGDRVFVVHATDKVSDAWDNQFWIMSPNVWNEGDLVRISFRYKASQNTSAETQVHKNPSDYL